MCALGFQMVSTEARQEGPQTLRRKKRDWILPPTKLMENTDYTNKEYIAKIRSDKDRDAKVEYYLSGPGADKPPFNLFVVDHDTGFVRITGILDREKQPFYNLTGIAKYSDGSAAEDAIPLTIAVLDQNDNPPYFELHTGNITHISCISAFLLTFRKWYSGSVDENVADVVVLRIKALDKDLIHTDNWLTVFTIAKGNEDNLFSIETDKKTNEGILKLIKPVDFEEVQNLELGLIIENVAPLVEGGAVLMDVNLQVGEGDPLATGTGFGTGVGAAVGAGVELGVDAGVDAGVNAGVNVGIAVNNMPEGPAFIPDTKKIPVSEDPKETPEDGVIAVFAATDPDTGKPAEDVSYAKAYDPGNWFTIDEETAEIKLNRAPDRESPFLVNGTYIAKILAITKDMPSKTATGTIAIQVTDVNDHCPTLTTAHSSLCSDQKTVYITGFDEDVSPNAAPFTFRIIPEGSRGSWDIEIINDTSAALHPQEELWPSLYELQVQVLDAQGLSCPTSETFTVHVCTCVESTDCSSKMAKLGTTSTSELSAPAIGMLLMAMCLLLLIPLLLLFCHCGGADTIFPDQFSDLPFDTKEHLISYHTEGKGDDKEVPLQSIPVGMDAQKKIEMATAHNFNGIPSNITEIKKATFYNDSVHKFQENSQILMEVDNAYRFSRESFNSNGGTTFRRQTLGVSKKSALYEDIALHDTFLNDYYSQKAQCAVPTKDGVLEYEYEGEGSPAGSVGCCSLAESDNDLQFLNDLGVKFKTLAVVCSVQTTADVAEPRPIYYTTTPVVQPMHYVVQPQLQKTVLLKTNETHGANYSGLYVVSGPQGSPAGLVIPKNSAGSTSPVSSTLFLPRAPGLAQGSVPAAPPQGVLDLAAQGSVYGILPRHTVKKRAINRNLGQTWVGQSGQIGLGPVTVLEVGIGQSTIGMGQMAVVKPEVKLAETLPAR
uniref:Uncharacterized LOC113128963 n=1 Tax=Mastacembelus armatus TaxID=205130 RepID=A0A3Q3RUB5_9TELE